MRRHPDRATLADIERLLGDLPADVIHEVCRLAEERQVPPPMLWRWAEAHSPTTLALALGAGYTRQQLALNGPSDCSIDRESLEMHAELNDSSVGPMVVRAVRHARATGDRQRRHHVASAVSGPQNRAV